MSRRVPWLLFLLVLLPLIRAYAQYEVPDEVFQRTILIRSGQEQATAFKFGQNGKIYLVTTRHFGRNLPRTGAVLQVWRNQDWNDIHTVRTLFPANKEIDLAIFETEEQIRKPYAVVKSTEVITTGQKVWYMGWTGPIQLPANMRAAIQRMPKTQRPVFPEVPFVSVATVSSIEPTRPDAFEINAGRSYNLKIAGGPIVYWSSVHRDYEILGIIARNERDAEKVQIEGMPSHEVVKSGIIKAYGIDLVVDTILDK